MPLPQILHHPEIGKYLPRELIPQRPIRQAGNKSGDGAGEFGLKIREIL
ncbi:MAG: hypothetical protein KIT44_05555 [Opitutaceae bacterium]|nr:hypothetical protein [Opitutaceae bacterium]